MIVNTFGHTSTLLYFKRAHRFFPIIEPILKKNGIPADFKYLCVIESGLTNATSPAKAQGFWQFIKTTGQKYGLEINDEIDMRNNVEAAFGCDVNGDGTLDDSEAAFAVGWDCGEWFFRDIAADVAGSCAGSCGRRKLDWSLRLDQSLAPKTFRAYAGGAALPFPMTATMYDPSWNVARVTVRGSVGHGVVVKLGAMKEPLVIRMR